MKNLDTSIIWLRRGIKFAFWIHSTLSLTKEFNKEKEVAIELRHELGRIVSDYLRCCAHCGLSLGPIDLYCGNCWQRLEHHRMSGDGRVREHSFLPIYALFVWGFGSDRVSQLVQHFKGGGLQSAYRRLAEELLLLRICRQTERKRPLLFVPAPAKTPGHCDHAYSLASACATAFSGEVKPLLLRTAGEDQKSRNKKTRQKLLFLSNHHKLDVNLENFQIVFIDDVVTTGSTVRAAFKALGTPPNFEAWAIAFRPSLLYGAFHDPSP